MAETPKHTSGADPKYLYGTPEEIAGRLEHGFGPTESNFSQIKPSTGSSGGPNAQKGTTKTNRATIRHRA